jgi:hypothetical protein
MTVPICLRGLNITMMTASRIIIILLPVPHSTKIQAFECQAITTTVFSPRFEVVPTISYNTAQMIDRLNSITVV